MFTEISDLAKENKVLVNLRCELAKLAEDVKAKIKFDFVVLHLSEEDDAVLNNRTSGAREELEDEIRTSLPEHSFKIRLEGPFTIEKAPLPEMAPIPAHPVDFEGIVINAGTSSSATMYLGVGNLSQLVEIYKLRKDDLFSQNVRSFLKTKKNTEKGPSAKMRQTLKSICVDPGAEPTPEMFAFYHNGITVYARNVSQKANTLLLREPYVLNGCQTVRTVFDFRYAKACSSKVQQDRWERIKVPIRVVEAQAEDVVRQITINTNRQNAISAAALRANDPKQIELESWFAS